VSRTVLVIDDESDISEMFCLLLRSWGHKAWSSTLDQGSLELGREVRPEFVLLGIGINKAQGYALARQIRSEAWGGDLVLVAQTGWTSPQLEKESRAAGCDHHFIKPISLSWLEQLLSRDPMSRDPT
jgi:CheY-like chemotaxis protein